MITSTKFANYFAITKETLLLRHDITVNNQLVVYNADTVITGSHISRPFLGQYKPGSSKMYLI